MNWSWLCRQYGFEQRSLSCFMLKINLVVLHRLCWKEENLKVPEISCWAECLHMGSWSEWEKRGQGSAPSLTDDTGGNKDYDLLHQGPQPWWKKETLFKVVESICFRVHVLLPPYMSSRAALFIYTEEDKMKIILKYDLLEKSTPLT